MTSLRGRRATTRMPSGLTAIRRAPVSPDAKTLTVNPGGTASVAGTAGGCGVA